GANVQSEMDPVCGGYGPTGDPESSFKSLPAGFRQSSDPDVLGRIDPLQLRQVGWGRAVNGEPIFRMHLVDPWFVGRKRLMIPDDAAENCQILFRHQCRFKAQDVTPAGLRIFIERVVE